MGRERGNESRIRPQTIRCISGDHVAQASYRVTGNALAMGASAGAAAARTKTPPGATLKPPGQTARAASNRRVGTVIVMRVPWPGALATSNVPASRFRRSRIPSSPK